MKIDSMLLGQSSAERWEKRYIHKNGQVVWVDLSTTLQRDSAGNPLYFITAIIDITQRKKIEAALYESEQHLKMALDISRTGVWDLNLSDHSATRSLSHDQIFGYETLLPEWTYEKFLEHVLPDDRAEVDRKFSEAIANKTTWSFDCRIRKVDGEVRWIYAIGGFPEIITGADPKISGLVQDITERKQIEQEIKNKNLELQNVIAEKDKFFSIIAHDLRGPFGAILGLTESMAEGLSYMSIDQVQKIAIAMKNSATNLNLLISNLLEWSLMNRGITAFNPESFELFPKIHESIIMATEAASKKQIAVEYDIPPKLKVTADGNMLESIVRNLVTNAVKYTPEGGTIHISAQEAGPQLIISVKDTGIGMSKTIMENLFNPHANTRRKGTGGELSTGLGLMICKEFIEKHGGSLQFESEEGKGSTFSFNMPGSNEPPVNTGSKRASNGTLNNETKKQLTILIAEDDETSELLLLATLKNVSKHMIKVTTGSAAVAACRNNPAIELVMMDVQMPGMDGYEATRQIRQFNKEVIIIAQTAYGLSGESEKAMQAGCNEYISKPLEIPLLRKLIQKHFEIHLE
jgi:PAS domain S-box-containing protein